MVELPGINTFLKAEDIGAAAIVTFMNEGEIVGKDQTGFDHDVFNISIRLPNGINKDWTMNKTSQRMVAAKYGMDTKQWVGKTVNLVVTDQNVRGEMKKVIYVQGDNPAPKINDQLGRPIQQQPQAPAQAGPKVTTVVPGQPQQPSNWPQGVPYPPK